MVTSSYWILNSIWLLLLKTIPSCRKPGLLIVNSIVKTSKQGKLTLFFINNTNKQIRLKGSTIGKIETVKECNFLNVKDLNQQNSLKVSFLANLNQKIIVPTDHKEIVEDLIEKCRSLHRKGHWPRKDQYN